MTSVERALKIMDGTLTVKQLAWAVHCTPNTLSVQLRKLHRAGRIHIAGWLHIERSASMLYMAGPGVDAPKRQPTTSYERVKKFRAKLTAYEQDITKNRENTRRRKIKVDPLTAAFFWGKR